MIRISEHGFSIDDIVRQGKRTDAGAMVAFLGTVRDDGIEAIEVEAFREAAMADLEKIAEEAQEIFKLKAVEIVHRIGSLAVGDDIVLIACFAAHRDEAFQGCRYVIEELKTRAPIWKKELKGEEERWVGLE